jgi:addiction module HigA family antidote
MAEVAEPTERLGNPHPGDTLREDFLVPLGKTPEWLAEGLRLPLSEVVELLEGQRAVTAEIALRLNRFIGCSPDFWLGLQASHDLRAVESRLASELAAIQAYPMPHLVYGADGEVQGTVWEMEPAPG